MNDSSGRVAPGEKVSLVRQLDGHERGLIVTEDPQQLADVREADGI